MAILRLFAQAREAAGTGRDHVEGATVAEVLEGASRRYGREFADLLASCRIWVNGAPAQISDEVSSTDEIAVLPPVSGGA